MYLKVNDNYFLIQLPYLYAYLTCSEWITFKKHCYQSYYVLDTLLYHIPHFSFVTIS